MKPSRAPIAAAIALALQVGGACGGHYEEPVTDLTAMPQRPEVAPPAENGFGVIAGEVRQESLAASLAVAFEKVGLFRDGKLLATSTTDSHGRFRFDKGEAQLYDDGLYASPCSPTATGAAPASSTPASPSAATTSRPSRAAAPDRSRSSSPTRQW